MADLSFLSDADATTVSRACAAIQRGLGEKVRSVLLVGAAVPPLRHGGDHPLELLIIVSDLPVAALSNLAHQSSEMLRVGVRFRVLTQREVLRSADVFTLELAECQARHVLLAGDDPFSELHFTAGELRRSVEQTLRGLARQLRQDVFGAVCERPEPAISSAQLLDAFERLALVAPHALKLMGCSVPETEAELIRALALHAATEPEAVLGWLTTLRDGAAPPDVVTVLADLLVVVEAAAGRVDRLGASE